MPSPGKTYLKRMAQETREDQSKKRKKWIENLSVLSSEDEEEFSFTATTHEEEKQSILASNNAIYLRFPYYMGSDNSDDEDSIKYFPEISSNKREIKRKVSSSVEMNEISKENKSYKHTKRKQKSNQYVKKQEGQNVPIDQSKKPHKLKSSSHNEPEDNSLLNNKENKESLKKVFKCKDSKSTKKIYYLSEKSKNSTPHSLKSSNKTLDFPSAVPGDKKKEAPKKTSLRQRRAKAFGSVTFENLIDQKEEVSNVAKQKDEEFQLHSHNSSRFLDSSSENSNTEINVSKTKRSKYRRVHVLSTSSSSSDSEDNSKKSVAAQNLKQSENSCSDEVQSKSLSKLETSLKPAACISSEEENNDNSSSQPLEGKSEKVFKSLATIDPGVSTNSVSVGSNFQTKPTINASAWKSIAIADIKAHFNKQSKVEELKRKLASSNPSSVAIYKKIQKREMLRNKLEPQTLISRPKINQNRAYLHTSNEKTSCEVKFDDVPSTSASQRHDKNLVDSTLKNQIMENSDSKNYKATFHSGVRERKDSLAENFGENSENLHLPKLNLQLPFDSSPLDSDTKTSIPGKKIIRQAHNRELKGQNDSYKLNPQFSQSLKQKQSSKENKSKELKQISRDTSENCDVLGNIMSQMDKNPFKIQKPANKKTEPIAEMLGWFPAGSNASPLCGQTQNVTGLQQPRMNGKHNMPILPAANKTTFVTNNTLNPSYSPVCSAVVTKFSNTNQIGIEKHTDFELKNQEVLKVSKSKQTSIIEENASATTSVLSSGGKFVPFYSAPQEDYEGNDLRSKNNISNTKSSIFKLFSESKSDHQSSISNNKPPSLDDKKSSDRSLEGPSNNPISQEPRGPKVLRNNILNKETSSAVDKSGNSSHLAKRNSSPLHTNKSNSDKNVFEPTKHSEELLKEGPSQPQPGFPRGSGAIREEFKKNNSNSNKNTPKGIRVRFGGTEFRLSMKTTDNVATNDFEINDGQSGKGLPGQTSSSDVKHLAAATHKARKNDVAKNMTNENEGVPAKPVSSSSTTSSSSPNDSSTDDSSSESCDEGWKPSSTEYSSSDSRVNSPVLKDTNNIDKSNLSFQTEDIEPHINSQGQTQCALTDKRDLSLQPVQDPLSCSEMKANNSSVTSNNKCNEEVIILSGSSDSDSNDQLNDKEINSRLPGKVDKIKEQPDIRVHNTEELNGVSTASQAEKSMLNPNKVGTIRVKSLKELGVIHDYPESENALEPTQVCEVSQVQSNEQQESRLDTSASSTANTKSDKSIQKLVTNFSPPDKTNSGNHVLPRVPEKQNLCNNVLVKKPTKPITTIFLPVVPIAVINPVNAARVRPIMSSLNQEKNKESNLDPGSGNSSQVEASVPSQDNPLQTIASGSANSSNEELSQNPAEVNPVVMSCSSEDIEKLFFKLCDELFTEVVLFKIPKLAEVLHILITYDIMKEERLKKIHQLISPETIISEKRRIEKEFADTIKLRGQSFVPLFMTIVNRIDKENFKALLTAVYCRIVHQLERMDPVNRDYRYKIRNIIKSMLQKHRQTDCVKQDILTYFESDNDSNFLANFPFIEGLLAKYDNYVVQRQIAEAQSKNDASEMSQPGLETPESYNPKERINEDTDSSVSLPLAEGPAQTSNVGVSRINQTSDQTPNMTAKPPPPSIGNLDQVFLKRNLKRK